MEAKTDNGLVLVTGVTRGIGRAIAIRLLADGWSVIGVFGASEREAEELRSEHEGLELVQADLGQAEGVGRVVDAVGKRPIEALVNNAGIVEFEKQGEFDREAWERTLAVNLLAPVQLATSLAGRLGGGSVVNIASTDALRGSFNSLAYAASKAALLNATQSLANLLGPKGIRVNAVTPGWVDTAMADLAAEEAKKLTPLGRLGEPDEIAGCVAWLIGPEARFVNGASLVLDGGLINIDYVLLKEAEAGN